MDCTYPSVYSTSPCSAENRVGRCVVTTTVSGMVSVVLVNYYQPETTGHAESDCVAEGRSIRYAVTARFREKGPAESPRSGR